MQRVLARQALADYARRRAASYPSTAVISDLAPLVDRALSAGLALDEIRELATETVIRRHLSEIGSQRRASER